MDHSPARVIARYMQRADDAVAALTAAGLAAPPAPHVNGDMDAAARAYGLWVHDLEHTATMAGLSVEPEPTAATVRTPAEFMQRLEQLETTLADVRAELESTTAALTETERAREEAEQQLTRLRAALLASEASRRDVVAALVGDEPEPERPARGRSRYSSQLIVDALASEPGRVLHRSDLVELGSRAGFSEDAIGSALSRLKQTGKVHHNSADATYSLADTGNVVAFGGRAGR